MKKKLFDPVLKSDKFRGYLLRVTDHTKEYDNDKVEYDYYLVIMAVYKLMLIFWTYFTLDERMAYIYRPTKKQEFNEELMSYEHMNNYLLSLGLRKGNRPAGYGFEPSDHV